LAWTADAWNRIGRTRKESAGESRGGLEGDGERWRLEKKAKLGIDAVAKKGTRQESSREQNAFGIAIDRAEEKGKDGGDECANGRKLGAGQTKKPRDESKTATQGEVKRQRKKTRTCSGRKAAPKGGKLPVRIYEDTTSVKVGFSADAGKRAPSKKKTSKKRRKGPGNRVLSDIQVPSQAPAVNSARERSCVN